MNKTTLPLEQVAYSAITDLKATRRDLELAAVKVSTLQAENRRLRKLTQNGKQGRLLHRAAADARQIVGWRAAGYSVSRRNCYTYGMSIRRWQWAIALLKLARVVDSQLAIADTFLLDDVQDCLQAIEHTVRVVESGGLERLIVRLPRGAIRMPRR